MKEVIISDDFTQADVIVPDHQLSLAIGKEGQNARLAARLTGVRVDIRGETQHLEGPDDEDYAEGEWVENAEGVMEFHSADGSIMSADQWSEGGTAESAAPAAPTGLKLSEEKLSELPLTSMSAAPEPAARLSFLVC